MNDISKIKFWHFLDEIGVNQKYLSHQTRIYSLALDRYIPLNSTEAKIHFYSHANEPLLSPLIVESAGTLLCDLLSELEPLQKEKFSAFIKDNQLEETFLHFTSRAIELGLDNVFWKSCALENIYAMFLPKGLLDISHPINQEHFLKFFSRASKLNHEETKRPTFIMLCKLFEHKDKFNLPEEFTTEVFCLFMENFKIKQIGQKKKFSSIYESVKKKDLSAYFTKYPTINDLFNKEDGDVFIKEKTINILEVSSKKTIKNGHISNVFELIFDFLKKKAEQEPLIKDFYVLPKKSNSQKILVTFTTKNPFVDKFLELPLKMFRSHEDITKDDNDVSVQNIKDVWETLYFATTLEVSLNKNEDEKVKGKLKI